MCTRVAMQQLPQLESNNLSFAGRELFLSCWCSRDAMPTIRGRPHRRPHGRAASVVEQSPGYRRATRSGGQASGRRRPCWRRASCGACALEEPDAPMERCCQRPGGLRARRGAHTTGETTGKQGQEAGRVHALWASRSDGSGSACNRLE